MSNLDRVVHRLMQSREPESIERRAEGTLSAHVDSARDVGKGVFGALAMLLGLGTPFLRARRSHWGLTITQAERVYPGDELVPEPRWGWTHAVEIEAPPDAVWPWITQLGQGKAGFYSYQWLENLVGCDIQNADRIRPEWQTLAAGDPFRLHPNAPPLRVAAVGVGRYFVVTSVLDPVSGAAPAAEQPGRFIRVSWLFLVESLENGRSRFVSRYRIAYGKDVRTRLAYGPSLVEPVGFVMDRGMLLGVKRRVEGTRAEAS